ncbi:MAG: 3-isopropylmalate dehydratase small subunit [Acidobacteria bacterium]|nr:3-isopropylmalate dehydratase small subunit [Acidobacteriota bacterium]
MGLRTITSRMVALPYENVDTDQIIPARFLKTTERSGMGKLLFHDWRYDPAGNPRPDFILNRPEIAGAAILLAGNNFGCGSSREHAPWALADFGFRAIISTSFADIFRNNCLKNGILPVLVGRAVHQELFALAAADPNAEVTIDLEDQTLSHPNGLRAEFPIDAFSKKCLIEGVDDMGYLLGQLRRITEYEERLLK